MMCARVLDAVSRGPSPLSSPNATTYMIWIDVLKLADTTLLLPFTDSCDPAPLSEKVSSNHGFLRGVLPAACPSVRPSVRHSPTHKSLAPTVGWRWRRSSSSRDGGNIQIIAWCLGSSSPDVIMPNSLLIIKNKLKNIWRLEMRGPLLKYLMRLINDTIFWNRDSICQTHTHQNPLIICISDYETHFQENKWECDTSVSASQPEEERTSLTKLLNRTKPFLKSKLLSDEWPGVCWQELLWTRSPLWKCNGLQYYTKDTSTSKYLC